MKDATPQRLALILAVILSAIVIVIFLAIEVFESLHMYWFIPIVIFIALSVLFYYIIRYALEKFIYNRIKLIYKTIHRQKLLKEEKKDQMLSLHDDIIGSVDREVSQWAINRKEEIEELMKMELYRREFLGNVSHELKTPLFNIQGFLLTLLDGGINDPEINYSYLEKSSKNIDRMITIIEELEMISRLETGEATPIFTQFSVVSLIKEVFELLEPIAQQSGIKLMLATDYSENLIVSADKEKIRQVFINLIENSLKYGKPGGRTKISIYDMDENYLIEVSDNGVGIQEQHIPRLFERFYRIDKHRSRSQGGSGLGLAIVKHIVEAHNQTVNVRSAHGVGSTFSFTLKRE